MKLGDGGKVDMHVKPVCSERDHLASKVSQSLAEWLACNDDVGQTSQQDRSLSNKLKNQKDAKGKLKAAKQELTHHAEKHGCW